jgi:RHS repeat-associated protein
VITDLTGSSQATYTYDPYGGLASSTGTITNPFRFCGQYQDSESGFYYLRARYYDPTTGQFLSMDSRVGFTLQPYAYVAGNPLNIVDPTGRFGGEGDEEGGPAPNAFEIMQQFRELTPAEQDQLALARVGSLRQGQGVQFNSSKAARQAFREGSNLRGRANIFFDRATSKCYGYKIARVGDAYEFSYFAPADNPGYTKEYVYEVDAQSGTVIEHYKVTYFESESLQIKYIRHNGSLVDWDFKA